MADKSNITINITGANPQIYPSAEQITHNHYYGDQFAEDAIKANKKEILMNQEGGEKEDITDELYAILQDKELYEETVKWAKTCSRPRDIKNRICEPLRRAGFKNLGRDFAKALIPHLTNYESLKDIANIERSLL